MCCFGMIGRESCRILCMFMVDRFYSKPYGMYRRDNGTKGKWTKEFLNQYQMRLTKSRRINNRRHLSDTACQGKKRLESGYKSGSRESATARFCASFDSAAVYGTYRYEQAQLLRYEYVLTGAGNLRPVASDKQFMGFMNKRRYDS